MAETAPATPPGGTTGPAAGSSTWLARNRTRILAALAILGWGVMTAQAILRGEPIPPPPIAVPVPGPVQPARADELAIPLNYEGARFDGSDEGPLHVEAGGKPWPTKRITYWIDYASAAGIRPALAVDAIGGAFKQAWGWWAEGLDIEPVEVTTREQALVRIKFKRLDGPNGVLAQAWLPDGTLAPREQEYDVSERWTAGGPAEGQLSMPAVVAHEIGHTLGQGHDGPEAMAIMRPYYTAQIPRPTARDIDRAVAAGYARRAKGPVPPSDVLTVPVQLRTADVVDALKKIGYELKKP